MGALQTTTDLMRLLSEPARVRLLALLYHEELTVTELTGVTQLKQSRVSTHLGKLRDAGLVRDRRVGNSAFYSVNQGSMPADAERVWELMRESTRDPVLEQDRSRARDVVQARLRGLSWADAVAGQMERHYSPGRTWEASARGLLGLARMGDVLDVASGDGALAELIAGRARSVTCLDKSPRVIAAAEQRLTHLPSVHFVCGDMHALPFQPESFNEILLMNCLTYANDPGAVITETARVLRPGGSLVGVTLKRHEQRRAVEVYGHVAMGFDPCELRALLERAGLSVELCDVTSREARPPNFQILTFHAYRS